MREDKSRDENGNVQLTMAPGKDASGNDILLLDADIDENGAIFKHLADHFMVICIAFAARRATTVGTS